MTELPIAHRRRSELGVAGKVYHALLSGSSLAASPSTKSGARLQPAGPRPGAACIAVIWQHQYGDLQAVPPRSAASSAWGHNRSDAGAV